MKTFIALFRGINVGGKNILPMKELVRILEDLGCANIKTYIQSGNVIFQIKKEKSDKIAGKMSSEILKDHGFEPKVILLEFSELHNAVKNNPFNTDDGKALHFFFLDSLPTKPDFESLAKLKLASEEFNLINKVFYLYAPDGIGRSKLAAKVEKCLGVPTTARNWNTVNKMSALIKQENKESP